MSFRKMSGKTLLFSALLLIVAPLLPAEAQDVDVPRNLTMRNSTATQGNILKQGVPFIQNFGTNNTFLGSLAGNFRMTGQGNTATGTLALNSNTSGNNNTASGHFALLNNTSGSFNTASGQAALASNTTGSNNTATGDGALYGNRTGNNNTATGAGVLVSNTTGSANTANGYLALPNNTTGTQNTASGFQALRSNTTGGDNTASGIGALFSNTTGSANTASGGNALVGNTTGRENTAIGLHALTFNTTGSNNTALGAGATVSAGDLTNATVIGHTAVVNASNKIRLGNDSITVIEGLVGFTANSDRNRQQNFQPVLGEEVLRKIRDLSLTSWNYVGQEPMRFRHYGPAAQDFFDAFGNDGIGTIGTPTTITSTDIEGILMVAVQALERRTEENDALKARLEALERMVGVEVGGR
jgi:trimeric autotransporter adhesin